MSKPISPETTVSLLNLTQHEAELPLYARIFKTLKQQILSGEYPAGSLLPSEKSLCDYFSVSRHTVREALQLLREDRLVISRRGAGTVVIPPEQSERQTHQMMSFSDLVAFASNTRFIVESSTLVNIDRTLAAKTGLAPEEEWLQVCGYRYSKDDSSPICQTEYYINKEFSAVEKFIQHNTGAVFELIEDLFSQSITQVQQQISVILPNNELLHNLGEKKGAAALEVRRIYKTTENKTAQVTINIHPASRYQHSMTIRRINN